MNKFKYILLFFFSFIFFSFNLYSAECKKPEMPKEKDWQIWLKNIKIEALKHGISQKTIDKELHNVKPQKKIIMRDRCQPESTITFKGIFVLQSR